MPPKKKDGKKKKKKGADVGLQVLMKSVQRAYEKNCVDSLVCSDLKAELTQAAEDGKIMTKFVLKGAKKQAPDDPEVCLDPLLLTLRNERFTHIKDLHVWWVSLKWEEIANLALFLEKGCYLIRILELVETMLSAAAIERIARAFPVCSNLTRITLDFNEFGDEGCRGLCEGLRDTTQIISLSLNYCDLGPKSGIYLGHIVSTTAVRELYLDGNNLQCEGTIEIIKNCAEKAQEEDFEREEEARRKAEEELEAALEANKANRYTSTSVNTTKAESRPVSGVTEKGKKGKKGKKKGKKKKKPTPPPPVGPWLYKLHLADNGIDFLGKGKQMATLICMRLFRKFIIYSKSLEELDLDDNLIGDIGGRELMEALMERSEKGLPNMKVRTSHRMKSETFNELVKLGAGLKKKKKKGKKKKKK